jgi:NAD(P) transhydrogenase subunit beta
VIASFVQDTDFITALYIVAFSMFVIGIAGLTGPRTAVRGNRIAAVGMAIASSRRCSTSRSATGA